jgi:hypothetical protein
MTVANVVKRFQGDLAVEEASAVADTQDLIAFEQVRIPMALDGAAGTDTVYGSFKASYAFEVLEAVICPGAALTAADATANTVTLAKADGAGGSATTVASIVTNVAGGNWVADVFKPMTLSATPANRFVARGQLVTLKKTHASTGTVSPASTLCLRVRKV